MSTVDETGLAGEPPEGGLTTEPKKRFTDSAAFAWLQRFGKSLMLPIAALPAAALLLRFGQPDMLGADGLGWEAPAAVIGAAGDALFANLPLLFAIGLAIGMAR